MSLVPSKTSNKEIANVTTLLVLPDSSHITVDTENLKNSKSFTETLDLIFEDESNMQLMVREEAHETYLTWLDETAAEKENSILMEELQIQYSQQGN